MITVVTRKSLRWGAPVAVALAVGAGVGVDGALSADASPTLPHRTAQQLLVDLEQATPVKLSGTVVQHADMGIPALPTNQGESSNLSSLVSGSHTLRVWYGGKDKARVALVGTLGESDVIRNGRNVWIWSSQKNEADHLRLDPQREHAPQKQQLPPGAQNLTPQQLAQRALAAVDPTTAVKAGGTVSVAGRSAYQLSISPRTDKSLIGSIRIALDSKTFAPLRVQVFGHDNATEPALDAGFTYIHFGAPSDAQFRFDPPAGVNVKQLGSKDTPQIGAAHAPRAHIVGKGWKSVLVLDHAGKQLAGQSAQLQKYLNAFTPVSGAWGSGRLFHSALVNVLLTNDGRIIAGAVTPQLLYDAATR